MAINEFITQVTEQINIKSLKLINNILWTL
jgi:hypothetical protein